MAHEHDPPPGTLSRAALRALLGKVLISDSDLDAFCLDHFPEAYRRFSAGMDRVAKVNLLLERTDPGDVLAVLRQAHPEATAAPSARRSVHPGLLALLAGLLLVLLGTAVRYGPPLHGADHQTPHAVVPTESARHDMTLSGKEDSPKVMHPAQIATPARRDGPAPAPARPSRSRSSPLEQGPHLIKPDGQWAATGFPSGTAALIQRGSLLAAQRPIAGSRDREYVAVFRVVETPQPESATVKLALVCEKRGGRLAPDLTVASLSRTADVQVGQCLARVLGEAEGSPSFVRLNVGRANRVHAGDEYAILGESVVQKGFVPLGLDTDADGHCRILEDGLQDLSARCQVLHSPSGAGGLAERYAVHVQR